MKVVTNGLRHFLRREVVVNTTMVRPLGTDRTARPRRANGDGAAIAGNRRMERMCVELVVLTKLMGDWRHNMFRSFDEAPCSLQVQRASSRCRCSSAALPLEWTNCLYRRS